MKVNLLGAIDVAGYCWEDGEVPSLHGEAATDPDLVKELRLGAIVMHGESQERQKEEDDCIDSLEADEVLNCSPDEPETRSTEKACTCHPSEILVIIEINVSVIFENYLNKVTEAHRECKHEKHVPEGAMLHALFQCKVR